MRMLLALICFIACGACFGQAAEVPNANPETERRLKHLAEELRCLVCQNQTIADSNATLAVDLRNQIRGQIGAGRSDDQIRSYMVERYGDFVLYRPPFKATTVILWLGPVILLALGVVAYAVIVRRRRTQPATPEPAAKRRAELEKLLEEK